MLVDQFRLFTKALPDPICLLADDEVIQAANPAFCHLIGAKEPDLVGQMLHTISRNDSEDIGKKLNLWRRSSSPTPGVLDLYTRHGETLKCTAYGNLLKPPEDNHPALILLRLKTRNKTNQGFAALNNEIKQLEKQIIERKRAERELIESESRVRLLLESAGEMIFGTDTDGNLTFVNPALLSTLGYDHSSEIVGKNAFQLIQHSNSDKFVYSQEQDPIYQCIENQQPTHSDDDFFSRKDGTRFPVEYRSFPIMQHNDVVGLVITANDITNRRRAEEEILRLNRNLEKRVVERTAELEQAITKLAQSEKLSALGDLVAGVAHEINTPIGIGVTSATYLQEKVHHYRNRYSSNKLTQDDFENFLKISEHSSKIIVANLNRSADLIRSFKQVAVDQVSESRRDFNVKQYIDEVIQSLHPKLKQHDHEIHINCAEHINMNSFPGALAQIITNLILNSVMHGFNDGDNGQIHINITQDEEYLDFQYSDNGVGMDENGVKKIFNPFYSTRRGRGGTGLGMHIVYNLVTTTFNGSIECQSAPQSGIQFFMKLHIPQDDLASPEASEGTTTHTVENI